MIKHKKVKRRHFKLQRLMSLVCLGCAILYVFSLIFFKTQEVSLNVAIQNTRNDIAQIKMVNEALALEVSGLANYERVATIATEQGLMSYQNNVIALDDINE